MSIINLINCKINLTENTHKRLFKAIFVLNEKDITNCSFRNKYFMFNQIQFLTHETFRLQWLNVKEDNLPNRKFLV